MPRIPIHPLPVRERPPGRGNLPEAPSRRPPRSRVLGGAQNAPRGRAKICRSGAFQVPTIEARLANGVLHPRDCGEVINTAAPQALASRPAEVRTKSRTQAWVKPPLCSSSFGLNQGPLPRAGRERQLGLHGGVDDERAPTHLARVDMGVPAGGAKRPGLAARSPKGRPYTRRCPPLNSL